jgi:transcriptional regulator with XRE-family HTH domain
MTDGEKKLVARRVGALMQEKRRARGETATDVAARIGLARQNYRRFEKGVSMPQLDTVVRVARALECSATEILTEALKGIS